MKPRSARLPGLQMSPFKNAPRGLGQAAGLAASAGCHTQGVTSEDRGVLSAARCPSALGKMGDSHYRAMSAEPLRGCAYELEAKPSQANSEFSGVLPWLGEKGTVEVKQFIVTRAWHR